MTSLPTWFMAGFWGLLSGSALVLGALGGYILNVSQRTIALIMGFGAGVLISALSFDLMDKAYSKGGFMSASIGFLSGALTFTIANFFLSSHGAKHRKRSEDQQARERKANENGMAIAAGALFDGIPEAMAIGISMVEGGIVSTATVVAIFISNIPEGLSSTTGMKKAGRSKAFIFGTWSAIAILTAVAAVCGYVFFHDLSPGANAVTLAFAAGAILCMLADTMIPEAFDKGHNWVGLITVIGFLLAFVLTKA